MNKVSKIPLISAVILLLTAMTAPAYAIAGTARLYTPPAIVASGSTISLPVVITNTSPVVATQFTVTVPEGWVLYSATADNLSASRKTDHELMSAMRGDNSMMVMVYSPTNSELRGNDGPVLDLKIKVPSSVQPEEVYNVTLSEAVVAERSGANILNDVAPGTITIGRSPDFAVDAVTVTQDRLIPGADIDLSWTVTNLGDIASATGWKETIYLADESGNETAVATTRNETALAPQAVAVRATTVTLPAILGVDSKAAVKVKLTPFGGSGEDASATANNEARSALLPVNPLLTLSLIPAVVDENRTAAITAKVSRSGSYRNAETFGVSAGGFDRISLPQTVTIPAGASQTTFAIHTIDNTTLDADSVATITVSGGIYAPVEATLTVIDDDNATLTATLDRDEITEGEGTVLTISTNRVNDAPVTVYLSCADKRHFSFPASVVIPAGESSVDVEIASVDDDVPSTVILSSIRATAARHDAASADITVNDNDTPTIDLLLNADKVAEGAGYNAIRARLVRSTLTDSRVTVKLTTDKPGVLIIDPATITINKGVKEVEFTIGVIDNATVDGDRDIELTAAVYVSSCSCSVDGDSGGSVTKRITVIDNDGPALTLRSSASNVREGQSFDITVTRNTPGSTTPLDVALSVESGRADFIDMPATVTIPAGETSAKATVTALANDLSDDSQTLVITASAADHAQGVCYVSVTDQTLPDAVIRSIAFNPEAPEAGTRATVSVTVANDGVAPLNAPSVKVTSGSSTLAALSLPGTIAAGSEAVLTGNVTMPASAGTASITATVTAGGSAKELSTANNTMTTTVDLAPSFGATVSTAKAIYSQGEEIVLSGQATGSTAAKSAVEVYTIVDGVRTTTSATTDDEGRFSVTLTPSSGMSGHYTAGACYPGENATAAQCEFDVRGLRISGESSRYHDIAVGTPLTVDLAVSAPGNLEETGLRAEVVSAPDNLDITFDMPDKAGNIASPFSMTLDASKPSATASDDVVKIRLTSASGTSVEYSCYVYAKTATGKLTVDIPRINTTMTPGQVREYPIVITNMGAGETGAVTVGLPDVAWMKLATPKTMATIAPGESATMMLTFSPDDNVQLNVPITGNLVVNATNSPGVSIPFTIEPVSDTTGILGIEVCDEYTYYTAEAPRVKGATISVLHPVRKTVIATAETGDDGRVMLELPAGYYNVTITEPNHESFSGNIMVDPGKTTTKSINLSFQAITVDWSVVETEVEDEYKIVTTLKYETSVPMPVVVTELPDMKAAADMSPGESMVFYAVLTNKGLITAHEAALELEPTDGILSFEVLNPGPYEIAANQSVTVPIKVSYPATSTRSARIDYANEEEDLPHKHGDKKGDCTYNVSTIYAWDCGLDRKWHRYSQKVGIWICGNTDINWSAPQITIPTGRYHGNGGGWGLGGASSSSNPVSGYTDTECTPCQNSKLTRVALPCGKAILYLIPYTRPLVGAYDEVAGAVGDITDKIEEVQDAINKAKELYGMSKEYLQFCEDNDIDITNVASWSDEQLEAHTKFLTEKAQELGNELIGSYMDGLIDELKEAIYDKLPDGVEDGVDCVKGLLEKCTKDNVGWGWKEDDPDKEDKDDSYDQSDDDSTNTPSLKEKSIQPKAGTTTPEATISLASVSNSRAYALEFKSWKKLIDESAFPDLDKALYSNLGNLVTLCAIPQRMIDWLYTSDDWLNLTDEQADAFSNGYKQWSADDPATTDVFREATREFMDDNQFDAMMKRLRLLKGKKSDQDNAKQRDNDPNELDEDLILLQYLHSDFAALVKAYDEMTDHGKRTLTEFHEMTAELEKRVDEEADRTSVCASITLQLSQSMVMTRQAFRGTLTVYNGNESKSMTQATLNLEVTDDRGNVATLHEMQTSLESLDGFTGPMTLDGGWELAPRQTGTAKVLFIPTRYAAPDSAVVYSFAGALSYLDPFTGTTVSRTLAPVSLTVKPSPVLDLTYFMQRDIIADDPLTAGVVEKREPAEFSLIISNKGRGDATDIRITTEQPKITENEKGLLIDFELLSSQLNGGEHTLALGGNVATEVGDIAAGGTAYAQWWMEASLLGHFIDYDIEETHVTSYGNPDLSLLDDVTIHELIRSVDLGEDPETGVMAKGFLVNDEIDADDTPDIIYLTDGSTAPVVPAAAMEMARVDDTTWRVTVTAPEAGWAYGSTPDLTAGRCEIVSVTRDSDSKEIAPRNFWATYVTLRDGRDPLYEYRLHMADDMPSRSETYTVVIAPRAETELTVEKIEGVPADNLVARESVTELTVTFNKPVIASTFTADDITLTRQGEQLPAGDITVSPVDDTTFTIGLGGITAGNGYYTLTVATEGIYDTDNFTGRDGKMVGWTQFRDGMVSFSARAVPAGAGGVTPAAGAASHGSSVTFAATPAEGYELTGWWEEGATEALSTDPELTVAMLDETRLEARFAPRTYLVSTSWDSEGGSVDGALNGTATHGTVLRLRATVNEDADYTFGGWLVNGSLISTDAEVEVPVVAHTDIQALFTAVPRVRARYVLSRGWNWMTVAHRADKATVEGTFPALHGSIAAISGTDGEAVRDDNGGLSGSLSSLAPGGVYRVNMSAARAVTIIGSPIEGLSTPLVAGWNHLPALRMASTPLSAAIPDARDGEVVKGLDSFAVYDGGAWRGTLVSLEPGAGYMLRATAPRVLTQGSFDTAAGAAAADADLSDVATPWSFNSHDHADNMPVIARVIDRDGNRVANTAMVVAAFGGDRCRGIATADSDGDLQFLTVHGDTDGEPIRLMVFDTATSTEMRSDSELQFTPDLVGSIAEPLEVAVSDLTLADGLGYGQSAVYPNPTADRFFIKGASSDAGMTVTVYNSAGTAVVETPYTNAGVDVSALPSGTYIVTVRNADNHHTHRLIKIGQ
ncbi:MAG: T9SS type A sorting domain-containing protein [Pseudoflavonifractor sp.]|nr:T9SS type A sorting domain-containing protein [Pseudoflavonifractor sp.]